MRVVSSKSRSSVRSHGRTLPCPLHLGRTPTRHIVYAMATDGHTDSVGKRFAAKCPSKRLSANSGTGGLSASKADSGTRTPDNRCANRNVQ